MEIESKKRIKPSEIKDLKKFLLKRKKVEHTKSTVFFDQFLDTPQMDLLKKGASMRIRYKAGGSKVYLQYKGPGFIENDLLYRSEFSSGRLKHIVLEESHHDTIHFTKTSIQQILSRQVSHHMAKALRDHLGNEVVKQISEGPVLAIYQKEKFLVRLDDAYLEPSIDQILAFHINKKGMHPLSTFWEYENEIKSSKRSLDSKLEHIHDLLDFDAKLEKKFDLKTEKLDKYHRCASIFIPASFKKKD